MQVAHSVLLVSHHFGCVAIDGRQRRLEMVDSAVSVSGLDHCLSHRYERHPKFWKGEWLTMVWRKCGVHISNWSIHFHLHTTGRLLHITISIHCAHHILHTGHNVRGSRRRYSAHVYARNVQATAADGMAGRSYSGILLVRAGIWIVDCIRQLQHTEK